MKLLINNTESVQPEHEDGTLVVLYGRNPDQPETRYEVTAHGFRPYFYAREDECRENESFLLGQESIQEIEYGGFDAFNAGDDLAKVYPPYPQDTRSARELFNKTWNADVPFTNRFRIDTGLEDVVEVPEPEDGDTTVECHWREIEPVVPASSGV